MDHKKNWTQKLSVGSELTKEMCVQILRTAPSYQNVLGIEEDALNVQSFKAIGRLWMDKALKQHLLSFLKIDF